MLVSNYMKPLCLPLSLCLALFLAPASALAATNEQAEQQLFDLQLTPAALFPDDIPDRLVDADVTVSENRQGVGVRWDLPNLGDEDVNDGYLVLQRSGKKQFKATLKSANKKKLKPKRVKIGSLKAYRVCGHVCGYFWLKSGVAYSLFGMYYEEDLPVLFADQRSLIASLAPVEDQGLTGDEDEDYFPEDE